MRVDFCQKITARLFASPDAAGVVILPLGWNGKSPKEYTFVWGLHGSGLEMTQATIENLRAGWAEIVGKAKNRCSAAFGPETSKVVVAAKYFAAWREFLLKVLGDPTSYAPVARLDSGLQRIRRLSP